MSEYMVTALQSVWDCPEILKKAFEDMESKSPTGDSIIDQLNALECRLQRRDGRTLLLVSKDANTGVVAMVLVLDALTPLVGTDIAYITYLWIAEGHNGEPFRRIYPKVEQWAKGLRCGRIALETRRWEKTATETWLAEYGLQHAGYIYRKEL